MGKGSEGNAFRSMSPSLRALFIKEIFLNIKYYVIIYYLKKCHQNKEILKTLLEKEKDEH
jgi:hypothetical protein